MAEFEAPVPTTAAKADALENLHMMEDVEPDDDDDEEEEPELVEPGMTYQDHLNMQEFLNQLPSPKTPKVDSPRTANYAMMNELESGEDTDSEEDAKQKFLEEVARYVRDLMRSGLE